MEMYPFISIIIPMYNEKLHVQECIDSILRNNYPSNRYEILIIDGMSSDGSREIVQKHMYSDVHIELLNNPERITPIAFNIGIKAAIGDLICILSAHCYIDKDFFVNAVKKLNTMPEIDCIGGPAISTSKSYFGNLVAFVTSSKFGTGSFFRYGSSDKYVDTVPFPIFRRDTFKKVGLYNERLERNQDNEFNYRLRKNGGKIYFSSDIKACVYVRSDFISFIKYNFRSGKWNYFTNRLCKHAFALRHFVPFSFVVVLLMLSVLTLFLEISRFLFISLIISYLITSFIASFSISTRKGWKYYFILPWIFFSMHFSYGLGTLYSLLINWQPTNKH